jgi:DNA primase
MVLIKSTQNTLTQREQTLRKDKSALWLFQAKKKISELRRAVLVEGYTDVISLHQAGVNYAIAPCGTSLTESQVKLIARVAKYVTVFMDGDEAGLRAVFKDINLLLAGGLNVQVCICPDGKIRIR